MQACNPGTKHTRCAILLAYSCLCPRQACQSSSGACTYDLKGADDVGMVQQANDIHAALRLDLEVAGGAGPHALVPHQGALAQQLHSIQIHVCAVQHQLDLAKSALPKCAHYDVVIHKGDALQGMSCQSRHLRHHLPDWIGARTCRVHSNYKIEAATA